jgi:DASS family divalent anion:Na+ symporter
MADPDQKPTPHAGPKPAGFGAKRYIGLVAGLGVAAAILMLPSVGALTPLGQRAFAILAFGVVLWATDVLNSGVTAVLVLGLLLCVGVPASVALSGFASSAFWTLVCVMFFGTAMDRTGLARRLAYGILSLFPATFSGILAAFLVVGFVLMLGIPSMTVRAAIMVPIAWALVRALNLERPSRSAAIIVLTAFEMAVFPGVAILTGALWGPYVAGLFSTSGIPLTWVEYAKVLALPTTIWCVLVVLANRFFLAPKNVMLPSLGIIREEMAKMGAMKPAEKATAIIVGLSVVAWALQPLHHLPNEAIGMLALTALVATKVLAPPDLGSGIPWPLMFFIGGMLSVTNVITAYQINTWLAGVIVPALQPFTFDAFVFVFVMAIAVALMRFVEPGGFITIAAFFLALVAAPTPLRNAPLALVGCILFPLHVFWFSYQNIWMVMTDGITGGEAYTASDRVRFASVFMAVTLVALIIAAVYWRAIGLV